ncbi:hypothetical protein EVAR_66393_1 [Eumeta japonica]|uniref:Uncharacterized protein n=1 Tax=Eumeta variegata TaxID=151549 RepID=A0A4C1ZYK2_EUMVA|nr:hypothetical protein EVAR_66393_1 [Eumeta japonica]
MAATFSYCFNYCVAAQAQSSRKSVMNCWTIGTIVAREGRAAQYRQDMDNGYRQRQRAREIPDRYRYSVRIESGKGTRVMSASEIVLLQTYLWNDVCFRRDNMEWGYGVDVVVEKTTSSHKRLVNVTNEGLVYLGHSVRTGQTPATQRTRQPVDE